MELTLEERGAYTTFLDLMYDRGGPIIDNERLNAGYLGVSLRKYRAIRSALIEKGKIYLTDSGEISNRRFDKEHEKNLKTSRNQSENGKRGGYKKSENKKKSSKNNDSTLATAKPDCSLIPEARNHIEESSLRSDSSAEADPIDAAFDAYNDMVQQLPIDVNGKPPIPICRKRTTARRRSMKARLKDCGGLTGWGYALEKLANTPGLLGGHGGNGHEGWTADIDFLLSEQKFTRLMEGKYDNWGKGPTGSGPGPTMDDLRRAADEADRRETEGVT